MSKIRPDLVEQLADLRPISKDPIEHQAARLVKTMRRYEEALVEHGILSPQATAAGDAYDLVARLYAPSLVGALARQLVQNR